MMTITIQRLFRKKETLTGRILVDGLYVCDCAENADKALKTGVYNVSIARCKQYARHMPVILLESRQRQLQCDQCPKLRYTFNNTVLPCVCPMLKPGNGVYNRKDGSIIVGRYLAPGCLSHPKNAFDTLYDRIRKNIERGNKVMLEIH